MSSEHTYEILIVGSNSTSIGVARSLAEKSIPCTIIDRDFNGWGARSKYADTIIQGSDDLVESLVNLGKEKKQILYLSRDRDVLTVTKNRNILEKYYVFNLPDYETSKKYINKNLCYQFLEREKLPFPKAKFFNSVNKLSSINPTGFEYPLIIKIFLQKAEFINSQDELMKFLERIKDKTKPVVMQKYIEGPTENIFFVFCYFDKYNNCLAAFSGHKIRDYPHLAGNTTFAGSFYNQSLINKTVKIFQKYRMVGYCSMEYKYNKNRNEYEIIEPTVGRFNLQIMLATKSGINFPHIMYQDLSNMMVDCASSYAIQKDNIYWVNEFQDFLAVKKSKGPITWLTWLKQLIRADVFVVTDKNDLQTLFYSIYFYTVKKINKLVSELYRIWKIQTLLKTKPKEINERK